MKTFSPEPSQPTQALFKIRGRMMPFEEFTDRLKTLSASLGLGPVPICTSGLPAADSSVSGAEPLPRDEGNNAAYVLSTKVTYNPNWGVYCGLPRLLDHQKTKSSPVRTPADFIAPFLHLYRFAQENIFLSQTAQNQYLITLPEILFQKDEAGSGCKLIVHLERVVEQSKDGLLCPVMISGTLHSFAVSPDFHQFFAALTSDWAPGRKLSIGHYLASELFSFAGIENVVDNDSPYAATILPHLAEIVTHPTPNLRAAEIHLQQVFDRDTARLAAERRMSERNLLYIAGLDIDMTAFTGSEEHYFVPWQAYISQGGKASGGTSLAQDDLFVRLMQQDTQCLV